MRQPPSRRLRNRARLKTIFEGGAGGWCGSPAACIFARDSSFRPKLHSSLNTSFLILYSASLAEMLRRDKPQILAQRPTLPRLFFKARVR